jgi:hypothetical protein
MAISHRRGITAAPKSAWASICRAASLKGARVHDLRHTYASVLASAGLSLPIIGQLLGHTTPTTTARYAHLFDDPLRAAAERAGAIITGTAPADIVPLPVRKRRNGSGGVPKREHPERYRLLGGGWGAVPVPKEVLGTPG